MAVSDGPESGDFEVRIRSKDRRVALEALQDKLAREISTCSTGVVAQVAAQFRATLKELSELPDAKKVSKADDLAKRRAARRAKAQVSASAARKGNKRGSRSG